MRKKLPNDEKRSNIIGIKVKKDTREKLNYIAKREGHALSTHIDALLKNHIQEYFYTHKINWDALPLSEKEGREE